MCTVSACFEKNTLTVTMSRDESRTRPEGLVFESEQKLYPVDAKQGGTWFGANKQGVVMCLLNLYEHENYVGKQSRGFIIANMLELGSFEKIEQVLKNEFDPSEYSAFSLLSFNQSQVLKTRWDGKNLTFEQFELTPWYFFTSSGLDTFNVQKGRNAVFNDWLNSLSKQTYQSMTVPSFHLLYVKGYESQSCFVQREKVHTKSISQISVNTEVTLNYYPQEVVNNYINASSIDIRQAQTFKI